jgi:hypothetical protein
MMHQWSKFGYLQLHFKYDNILLSGMNQKGVYNNPLTPKLNPSAQRCLTRFFTGNFSSWTVNFVNICVKNQQIHQLFIQFIIYGSSYMFRHYIAIFRERS